MSWPRHATRWSDAELIRDAARAREAFRQRRFGEPLQRYLDAFAQFESANAWLVDHLEKLLRSPIDPELMAQALRDEYTAIALRYSGAPPISADDLKTLADTALAWTKVGADPRQAEAIREVIASILDPKRFGWIKEARKPTKSERAAAVLASSVLAAAQRVQTARRGDEKSVVESAVRGLLTGMNFELADRPRLGIRNLRRDAPAAGRFMEGVNLGSDNADLIIGLGDGRVLAIECKGSNSEINNRKRLNKEAAQNARAWNTLFGQEVIGAAAIQGVFKPAYLIEAQNTPMVIFWGHRLSDLRDFIERCNQA